jgi:hypothetical protein
MANFKIDLQDGTEPIDIYIVENAGFGGEQSIIIYESPGGDGGAVLSTGRLNKIVKLDGKIIATNVTKELNEAISISDISQQTRINEQYNRFSTGLIRNELNEKIEKISNIRDAGKPIKLISPIVDNSVGQYIIRSFTYGVVIGQLRYVTFSMELVEYRQKGVKRASVNLVNFQPGELLKDRYNLRRALGE